MELRASQHGDTACFRRCLQCERDIGAPRCLGVHVALSARLAQQSCAPTRCSTWRRGKGSGGAVPRREERREWARLWNRRPSVVAPPTTPPGTPRPPRSRAALLAQPPGRQPTAGLRRGPFRAEHTELVAQPGVWSMPGGPMQLPTALLWQWQPGTPQTSTLEVSSCIHDWTIYEGFTNILLIIITDLRHQHRHQHHQVQDAEASSSASSGPGPRAPRTSGALASSRPRPDLLICDAL
ncbi:unnamed protein product [Prorocentrum cordatum]|uniref:Uncharacterized protein n=1 Tax=Prorocentrum cordatum TaxID=2364126 RepID=A0ABN9UV35_9DINO|nr:unnamed protein product [Polarella glacialis]